MSGYGWAYGLAFPYGGNPVDVVAAGLDRLWERFKHQPNIEVVLRVVLERCQHLEDMNAVLVALQQFDTSVGYWLEVWGKIVGLRKLSTWTDNEYRTHIVTRLLALSSSGTANDLITIARRLVGGREDLPASIWEGLRFNPNLLSLFDPVSGIAGVADESAYLEAFHGRTYDGVDDVDAWANVWDPGAADITISAWIRPDSIAAGLHNFFTISNLVPQQSIIFRRTGAAIQYSHGASVSGRLRTSSDVLAADTWSHVVAVVEAGTLGADIRLFHAGEEVASYVATSDTSGTPRATDGLWSLGGRTDAAAQMFPGDVTKVHVWDRLLADDEVQLLFEHGVDPSGAFVETDLDGVKFRAEWPRAYRLEIPNVPIELRDFAIDQLTIATTAGVRGVLVFYDPADSFAFRPPGTTHGFGNGRFGHGVVIRGTAPP